MSPEPPSGPSGSPPTLRGLLIALDTYPRTTLYPPLTYAVRDAELAYEAYSARLRTDLHLLVNGDATREQVRLLIQKIAQTLGPHDTFLLTFNGHGEADQRDGEAVFLTTEFTGWESYQKDRTGGFTLTDVRTWLNEALPAVAPPRTGKVSPENVIVLLDSCCAATAVTHAGAGMDIDRSTDHWPPRSAVAVICASANRALEDQERGQGLFSRFVLDWWRDMLWVRQGTTDLGEELHRFVQEKIDRAADGDPQRRGVWQRVERAVRGRVRLTLDSLGATPTATGAALRIDYLYPPRPAAGEGPPRENENCARLQRALTEPECGVRHSNVLVVSDRLMSTRFQAVKVARAIQEEMEPLNRPVLCLGANHLQTTLPFLCSLDAWRARRWGPFDWALEEPHLEQSLRGPLEALVRRLARERATVIVPHREGPPGEDVEYFLRRCAEEPSVRLCLIAHAEDEIPFFFREHRRIDMEPAALELEPGTGGSWPRVIVHSPRLRAWLSQVLHRHSLLPAQEERLHDNPRAKVAVYADLLDEVLTSLGDGRLFLQGEADGRPIGSDRLALLAALSTCQMPRPQRLVRALWDQLVGAGLVSGAEELDRTLHRLADPYRLIDVSEPEEPGQGRVYFLHSLVRQTTLDFLARRGPAPLREVNWDELVGRAYTAVLGECARATTVTEPLWPRAILAHQAVTHLLRAGAWQEAAHTLADHWDGLVNSGYQNQIIQWVHQLVYALPGDSIEALRVLLCAQSLRRHRQEFQAILDIHCIVVSRTKARLTGGTWQVDQAAHALPFWESHAAVGDYHLARRQYFRALAVYARTERWAETERGAETTTAARRTAATRLAFHCLTRRAYIFAQFGDEDETTRTLTRAAALLSELPAVARTSGEVHLLTVHCELYRIVEDGPRLYEYANRLWRRCLDPTGWSDESEKDNLTQGLARLHMAWACLFRGETLRAWFHALRARQFLNARGISEHWWIAETERAAALAIAWTLAQPTVAAPQPWVGQPHEITDHARQLVRAQVGKQKDYLERLIALCERTNPWRAAELRSALGQLNVQDGYLQRGRGLLYDALTAAQTLNHPVLAGYVLESLALSDADPERRRAYWRDAARAAAVQGLPAPASRRDPRPGELASFLHHRAGRSRRNRGQRRYPCLIEAELVWEGRCLRGTLTDLSRAGFRGRFKFTAGADEVPSAGARLRCLDPDYDEPVTVLQCRLGRKEASDECVLHGRTDGPLPLFAAAFDNPSSR